MSSPRSTATHNRLKSAIRRAITYLRPLSEPESLWRGFRRLNASKGKRVGRLTRKTII